jgi:hypothetical protein
VTCRGQGANDARRELEDGEEPSQGIEVLGVHGVLLGGMSECVVKVNLQVVELRVNIIERSWLTSEGRSQDPCSRKGIHNRPLISLRWLSDSEGWQVAA